MRRIALTGGTGFVGGAVLDRLTQDPRVRVSALARRPQPPRAGIDWVPGALDDAAALDALVAGADAVIHIAGVVNAPDRGGFAAGNATGTAMLIAAMRRHGVARLVHVSSLAAREPQLSDYGWSKAEAERHVQSSPLDWTMVRPPAIYGPGDAQLLELFQMAARGFMLLPPGGRASIVHVDDLARLLVALADGAGSPHRAVLYEVGDGRAEGWAQDELARAIGVAVGRPAIRTLALPAPLLKLGARIDRLARGRHARLTPDRAAYFCHPDWVARPALAPPADFWRPAIATPAGLAATAAAYRARGQLKAGETTR